MPLATRNAGTCAFCAFRISEWLAPSIRRCDVRAFATSATSERHIPSYKISSKIRRVRASDRGGTSTKTRGPKRRFDDPFDPTSNEVEDAVKRQETIRAITGRPKNPNFSRPLGKPLGNLQSRYDLLQRVIHEQYDSVLRAPIPDSWGIKTEEDLKDVSEKFREELARSFQKANDGVDTAEENPLFHRLKLAFVKDDLQGLKAELRYAIMASSLGDVSESDIASQRKLGDLRYPLEWYPATRALQRHIHLHVGPTNSGKTYHALKRLEEAESGIYAGPLRLLAHEVYSRFNAKGKVCALVTGEERRIPEGQGTMMSSCTVEMVPLNTPVEVAVIDEIQMLGDQQRGWAWTQALLGVQAKEVHLCGEVRVVPLLEDLCTAMGDKLTIHRYERLSPLKPANKSLDNNLKNLKKGDCIILFSRIAIHAMKQEVERVTGRRCAVVYGSLPPETRATQAELFNDPNNDYDFLVASDAVGMGLNLSIKRVIFESVAKRTTSGMAQLEISEIKQIGGRAGRFKTAAQALIDASAEKMDDGGANLLEKVMGKDKKGDQQDPTTGIVTSLDGWGLDKIKKAMKTEAPPLKTAGILPPDVVLARFAGYFPPETPFSYILLRLHEISRLHPRFHLCKLKEQVQVADLIQQYDLTVPDRIVFLAAPVSLRDKGFDNIIKALARCVADQSGGELLDINEIDIELLEQEKEGFPGGKKKYLSELEMLHKALTLYLWLSYRFAGVFPSQGLGFHVKGLVEEKINECLADTSFTDAKKLRRQRIEVQKQIEKEERKKKKINNTLGPEEEPGSAVEVLAAAEEEELMKVQEQLAQEKAIVPPSLLVDIPQRVSTPSQMDA